MPESPAMGDLAADTEPQPDGDGRYRVRLSADWEIWGPMGGYISAIALRAAGAEATLPRPASISVHYLGVATFDEVQLMVEPLRAGRSAESLRVTMRQDDRPILEALVCTIADVEGLEHDVAVAPDVPGPDGLRSTSELTSEPPPFAFWENFEARPLAWRDDWPPPGPEDPVWQEWLRFVTPTTSEDPWVDAARSVLLVDLPSWPSASRAHAYKWPERQEWVAPSLDLYVALHQSAAGDPWLLIDGVSPIATDGLIGWNARLWSSDRRLIASGGGQALCRRVRQP